MSEASEAGETDDAGLIVRVWREPGDRHRIRGRVLSYHGLSEPSTFAVTATEQDLLNAITTWIRLQASPPPTPAHSP